MRENIDNRSPEEIESDIERTRADFSSTIDAIQQKLTPSELKNQAVDYALSTTPGAVSVGLVNMVRENPIPVAMIGIGFAWLLAASRQPTTYVAGTRRRAGRRGTAYPNMETSTYDSTFDTTTGSVRSRGVSVGRTSYSTGRGGDGILSRAISKVSETAQGLKSKASDTAQGLKSKASETAQGLKSKAGDVSQRLSSTASDVSGRAQYVGQNARSRLHETAQTSQARLSEMGEMSKTQYYRAKDSVSHVIDEQPLIVGALGIAIGAALGASLPSTRRENELLGETRDNLLNKVKETALQQAEAVKQTAMQSAQRVAEVAKEEAVRVKDDVSSSVLQSKDQSDSASSGTSGTAGGTTTYGGGLSSGQQSIH